MYYVRCVFVFASCLIAIALYSQPKQINSGVEFSFCGDVRAVTLCGDFNQWQRDKDSLQRATDGCYRLTKTIKPGVYQYKYFVDGERWMLDPKNPVKTPNYNNSDFNSVFTVNEDGSVALKGYDTNTVSTTIDAYAKKGKTLFLNIIWHQHQPLYLDPAKDQLQGPWVRTHSTKSYFDMAAILKKYPAVHFNVNLTSSLIYQLEEYYVKRLRPFVNIQTNDVDISGYFQKYKGKTDPWIDIALKPTRWLNDTDRAFLLTNVWNAFGVSEVIIARFPQYLALKQQWLEAKGNIHFADDQYLRELKFWFYLALFDPDFLRGSVELPIGAKVDLTDLVQEHADGTFTLRRTITDLDGVRIVAEAYKVMASVLPIHRELMYDPSKHSGQIEVATTPFYHPILPLIFDSDLARICQPTDAMPPRFSYPQDAIAQVAKSVKYYKGIFGRQPMGMWPAEGSVAQEIIPIFVRNNITWIATDEKVLYRSMPEKQPKYYPYAAISKDGKDTVVVVFRDTELSDKIGFTYQNLRGEIAADDFIKSVLQYTASENEQDRLLTVILDGENAWEWYRYDNDGKEFLNALYRKLSRLYDTRQIITVTVSEYIHGNPERNVPAHPIRTMSKIDQLWRGSWINANYDTWIGESEENKAWEYLLTARKDLARSGIRQPDPFADAPKENTKVWHRFKAWEEMYAAEGSDWFWWYGADQTAPAGDKPFDDAFITHLTNIYAFAKEGGGRMPKRDFPPIIHDEEKTPIGQGTMAKSKEETVTVLFQCDASNVKVEIALYIAGNCQVLENWTPNKRQMFDDGTHGDKKAGDHIWSVQLDIPMDKELQYKYTNSGLPGQWTPGEEFPSANRTMQLDRTKKHIEVLDVYGKK
jgi:alpha-amylase/alpha-mannosidase (GH57 family)